MSKVKQLPRKVRTSKQKRNSLISTSPITWVKCSQLQTLQGMPKSREIPENAHLWTQHHLPSENKSVDELSPIIEAEHCASHKLCTTNMQKGLKFAKAATHRAAKHYASRYWNYFYDKILAGSTYGNLCAMSNGINRATGPNVSKIAPLYGVIAGHCRPGGRKGCFHTVP